MSKYIKKQHKHSTLAWKLGRLSIWKNNEKLQAINYKVWKICTMLEATKCIWNRTLVFKIEPDKQSTWAYSWWPMILETDFVFPNPLCTLLKIRFSMYFSMLLLFHSINQVCREMTKSSTSGRIKELGWW